MFEREQVADGVVVLRAVETMDGADPAGIGVGTPGAIELGFQKPDECRLRCGRGRGRPLGGMVPARRRVTTFSHSAAWAAGSPMSSASSAKPPVLSRSL